MGVDSKLIDKRVLSSNGWVPIEEGVGCPLKLEFGNRNKR